MAVFQVRKFGDPVLRRRADAVASVDDAVRKLMADMRDTMFDEAGVGLAAPQIGVSKAVIVWQFQEDEGSLANPRILDRRGEVEGEESCLSIRGLVYPVLRSEWVRVEGLDSDGAKVTLERSDWVARILQHEIDHTQGILFIDRLTPEHQKEARKALREQTLGLTEVAPAKSIL